MLHPQLQCMTLSLVPEPFCDVKLQDWLVPRLRHVRTCHHQVGRVCTAEAVRAVDTVIKGAARRVFVLHAGGWPQRLLVLLSGLGSRPT